ncbi:protein of unknown function (DUF928) [Cylindrospermum stagnale PCC 7417]|uniref:DUF928 domain-containing protein n=1 Tax=Cylindrospermum stagnale PCC 7417 TaxID=56107 RepID=K9WVU5_9NOST|nr:DUF928 domain-containing protein [Cylindrospermum stagnale]AFZ23944.1 protein of unknown function (DUF928) [Cylindrospermum stagnale PCC 7417]
MKPSSQPIKLFLALTLSGTSFLGSLTAVLAKPAPLKSGRLLSDRTNSKTVTAQIASFNLPAPPPGPSPGGRSRGGAKRGECPKVNTELTALVPFTKKGKEPDYVTDVWGLTTEENPTWLFYVPYTKASAYTAEFVLQDEQDNSIYQIVPLSLPDQPGIIRVSLPANTSRLEVGKRYRWFLTVNCNQNKESLPVYVYVAGVIQRVNLSQEVAQKLKTATPQQQVAIYAQNGVWHEALTKLAELRQQYPQDLALQAEWQNLLASFQFDDVAAEPIVSAKP